MMGLLQRAVQWCAPLLLLFAVGIVIVGSRWSGEVTFAQDKFSPPHPPTHLRQIIRDPVLSFAVGHVDVLPGTIGEVPILITPHNRQVTKISFNLRYAKYLKFEGEIEDWRFLRESTHTYQHDRDKQLIAVTIEVSQPVVASAIVVNIPLVAEDKAKLPEPVPQQDVRLENIEITVAGQAAPVKGQNRSIPYIIQTRLDVHINGKNDELLSGPERILLGATSVLSMPLGWRGYDKIKWDIYGDGRKGGIFYTTEPECPICQYRQATSAKPFYPTVYVLDKQGGTILSGTLTSGVTVYVPKMDIVSKEQAFLGQETTLQIQVGAPAPEFLELVEGVRWDFGDGNTGTSRSLETNHLYRSLGKRYQPTASLILKNEYQWDGIVVASQPIVVRPPILELTNSSVSASGPSDPNLPYPHNTTFFTVTVEGLYLTDAVLELDFGDGSSAIRIALPSNPNGVIQRVTRSYRYSQVGVYKSTVRLFSASFGVIDTIAEAEGEVTVAHRPSSIQITVDPSRVTANGRSSVQVRATVYDTSQRPVKAVTVVFQANPAKGTFLPAPRAETDASGVATVQFRPEHILEWNGAHSLPVEITAVLDATGASLKSTQQVMLVPSQRLFIPKILLWNPFAP